MILPAAKSLLTDLSDLLGYRWSPVEVHDLIVISFIVRATSIPPHDWAERNNFTLGVVNEIFHVEYSTEGTSSGKRLR